MCKHKYQHQHAPIRTINLNFTLNGTQVCQEKKQLKRLYVCSTYLNRWIRTQCTITKICDDCCKSFPSSKYRSVYAYEHRSANKCLDIRRDSGIPSE